MKERAQHPWTRIVLVCGLVVAVSLQAGFALSADPQAGQRPSTPGGAGQSTAKIPTFPQKFDVQGPESASYGFAVTQPGPIVVEANAQGAPIVLTLQSPGGQPITQQGIGTVRVNSNATPQDVQRSLFWTVLVRAWCEDDCLKAGKRPRATGTVMVQHPPVNQAAVQQAIQGMTVQQKQPPQPDQQATAQAAAQMEQAFQQRKAQFEQQQLQRRANLYARIQPQLDQLRSRAGAQVKTRGVEDATGTTADDPISSLPPPNVIWLTDGTPGEAQNDGGEIGTRALRQIERPVTPGMQALSVPPSQPTSQSATFPQKFQVQGPETDSFGFGVTQPGPIEVTVDSQGPPVSVMLQHLTSAPVTQQGVGQIRVSHTVTPEEVGKSALWVVKIKSVQPGTPASGTVMVQHPAADPAIVQAQIAALAQQEAAQQARRAADVETQSRAEFQAFKANFDQQQMQRLAAERVQNQALISRLLPKAGAMIRSRGLTPSITRINKNEGQPKSQVIIEGTSLGPGGEVLFQLGPNITGTGIVEAWADTVVVVDVPDASGLLPFQGTIAIKVGQTLSNAVPFKFIPFPEVREIHSTQGDISIAQPGAVTSSTWDKIEHQNTSFMQLSGSRGNDIFFPTRQLSNGWVVQDIKPKVDPCAYPDCRGAYVADSRIGTPLAYFNMRWWHEALVGARYWFSLWIVGPRGVPDGILVTGPLTPNVPPGTPPPATTASSTPPASSSSSEPPQMTMGMIAPGLLFGSVQAAPGSGTTSSGTATANQPPNVTTTSPPSSTTTQPPATQPASTNPLITLLSVTQGQPGDPVMINGSNFGAGLGEIHFVIGPGMDLTAPAGAVWTDTQIFTSVPDKTGVLGFSGTVYIKRAADQKTSNLAAFRFEPTLEIREVRGTNDRVLTDPVWRSFVHSPPHEVFHGRSSANYLFGDKNNDELFINTRLKNAWVMESALVTCKHDSTTGCNGGVYVWETKAGTDWPYVNVRWWLNPDPPFGFSSVKYNFSLRLIGPKGLSDGVVVP